MTPTERSLRRLEEDLGELLDSRDEAADLEPFEPYRDDPVGFAREVLDVEPWGHQRRAMEAVRDEDRVAWRGANSVGKDFTVAALCCWWAYAVDGLVLLSAPTARQVHEILMRKEIARLKTGADLPGDLYTTALRIRREEASILAATSTEAGRLTGHHDRRILAVLTECQDVEAHGWEGLMACATGPEDRLLSVGNPLRPTGRFHQVSQPGSGWKSLQTAAHDHPNLREDTDRWIPGGPSGSWIERMADDYGETSPIWTARVEGEFPSGAVEGLVRREWLDAAAERWEKREDEPRSGATVAAFDPSRLGASRSALAIRRGPVLEELLVWEGATTTGQEADRVLEALEDRGLLEGTDPVALVIDEPGIGGGVIDEIRRRGWAAHGFVGGRKAHDTDRYLNRRSEAFWTLRRRLERGEITLPADEDLFRELLAHEWAVASGGRVQLEAKSDIAARLGGSPDRADAVAMAFAVSPATRPREVAFDPAEYGIFGDDQQLGMRGFE